MNGGMEVGDGSDRLPADLAWALGDAAEEADTCEAVELVDEQVGGESAEAEAAMEEVCERAEEVDETAGDAAEVEDAIAEDGELPVCHGTAEAPAEVDLPAGAGLWAEVEGSADDLLGGAQEEDAPGDEGILPPGIVHRIPEVSEEDPFPALTQYFAAPHTLKSDRWRPRFNRYFDASNANAECSDDGHLTRWAARVLCVICLDMSHQMRDCPHRRCGLCFQTGHGAMECPQFNEVEGVQAGVEQCKLDALRSLGGTEAPAEGTHATQAEGGQAASDAMAEGGAGDASFGSGGAAGEATSAADSVAGGGSDSIASDGVGSSLAAQPQVRCAACGACGVGHVNCSSPPRYDFLNEAIAEVADETPQAAFFATDDVVATFGRWTRPVEAETWATPSVLALPGGRNPGSVPISTSLESALLRFLNAGAGSEGPWREALASAPASSLRAAARRLGRMRALVPGLGQGCVPEVTSLGWWMSQLPVPPQVACALLHGALWGVLLPIAVLVVLLESVPPDLVLSDGTTPPRNSGHFALIAAYFRWREGRQTGFARRFWADFFWEAVDQRVIAICKHTQQALGYDGDDAAFEEMDGELMDVRRNDGRPWTLASALGGTEASPRWARFCAALAAAFPPQLRGKRGGWVVCTDAGEGSPRLETVVSSGHALIFGPRVPELLTSRPLQVQVDGIRGTLCGGEGAFEEALAIRQRFSERVEQAIDSTSGAEGPMAPVMDEPDIAMALEYLRGSSGDLAPAAQGGAELARDIWDELGDSIFDVLGRAHEDGAKGKVGAAALASKLKGNSLPSKPLSEPEPNACAPLAAPQLQSPHAGQRVSDDKMDDEVEEGEEHQDGSNLGRWALALAGLALFEVLKNRSIEAEDYDLSAQLQSGESSLTTSAAECRERAVADGTADRASALDRLARRKRKAVEDEDFDLAARIKRREVSLSTQPEPPKSGELERLLLEKAEAVAAEQYDRAAAVRKRQCTLEAAWGSFEASAFSRAASLAADGQGRSRVLQAVVETNHEAGLAGSVDDCVWDKVHQELRVKAKVQSR
mmetsp:Transcript_77798/g.252097  ORF Transcript_77798/g.252097 Transcript_77798/m.252097 type:complete len:1046 (-) Transcript_77798:465-3602(-)